MAFFLRSSLIVFRSEVITLRSIQTLHLFIFIIYVSVYESAFGRERLQSSLEKVTAQCASKGGRSHICYLGARVKIGAKH